MVRLPFLLRRSLLNKYGREKLSMNKALKKVWPALALSLVAFTSAVNAADDMQVRNLENRVSALEQRRGSNGMINPPAHPVVKDGVDLWVQADALYMKATEDGLYYAQDSTSGGLVNGHTQNVHYNWDWGFRLGLGFNGPHDGWDIVANWTWFQTSKHIATSASSGHVYLPATSVISAETGNNYFTQDSGKASLHFNMIDFEMGREFFVSKWLTLRPFVGARGLWFHRTLFANFSGGNISPAGASVKDRFGNKFRGGGLLTGLDTQWGLGSGWSIYGDLGLSLLMGRQKLTARENKVTSSSTTQLHGKDNWTAVRAITDLDVGLRWDRLFGDDHYRIRFQLGWEQHLFLGMGRGMQFVSSVAPGSMVESKGDFALNGVSLRGRFDF